MRSGDSPPAAPAGREALADREALDRTLSAWFPASAGDLSPILGGRRAAERRLAAIDPPRYGATRNHLDGAVTRLSPYLRHGVLTLAELREAVFAWLAAHGSGEPARDRPRVEKLLKELAWRDYAQRLWRRWGDGIWRDREPLASGHPADLYAADLPEDLLEGRTGLACIDAFVAELRHTGWLHNHVRLWLAAYLVHWRRVRWQAGAAWFLEHLLDGDPASNALGWQWVAGSFSHKPYVFNRANLERYAGDRHCRRCPRAGVGGAERDGGCPFEASYEALQERLFAATPDREANRDGAGRGAADEEEERVAASPPPPRRPVVWLHGEALGPANPALRAAPDRPAVFVFDRELIGGGTATTADPMAIRDLEAGARRPLSRKRLGFLAECLLELPVTVRHGDVAEEVLAFAGEHGADGVLTSRAVDPRFEELRRRIADRLPVTVLEPEPFVELEDSPERPLDLRRFSRYWRRAAPRLWAMAP